MLCHRKQGNTVSASRLYLECMMADTRDKNILGTEWKGREGGREKGSEGGISAGLQYA